MSEEQSAAFVKEFFSIGSLAEEYQNDYKEAFNLKHKCNPEDHPAKFRQFILAASRTDDVLKALFHSDDKRDNRKLRVSVQGEVPTIPTDENEPVNLIVSKRIGFASLKTQTERSSKVTPKSQPLLNPQLKRTPGCLCGNTSAVSLAIARPPDLDCHSYAFLDADVADVSSALAVRSKRLCREMLNSLKHRKLPIASRCVEDSQCLFVGRVVSDSEGPLSEFSAVMEPLLSEELTRAREPAALLLSQLSCYQVFPGQTVAVVGTSKSDSQGCKITANEIIPGIDPPKPTVVTSKLATLNQKMGGSPLHCVIAAGPFTSSSSFDPKILDSFITQMESDKPHILILLGPFVDVENAIVEAGDPCVKISGEIDCRYLTYEDLYRVVLERLIHSQALKHTSILLVPSTRDVCHPFPIPQPSFDLGNLLGCATPKNVHLLSNPCNVVISDVFRLSITSADPIGPIHSSLIVKGFQPAQRPDIVQSMLLKSRSFFPVSPVDFPMEPERFTASPCVWDSADLPHLLIYVCERLPPRARIVEGRAFINCGRTIGKSQPQYSQLWLHPIPVQGGEETEIDFSQHLAFDVTPIV